MGGEGEIVTQSYAEEECVTSQHEECLPSRKYVSQHCRNVSRNGFVLWTVCYKIYDIALCNMALWNFIA